MRSYALEGNKQPLLLDVRFFLLQLRFLVAMNSAISDPGQIGSRYIRVTLTNSELLDPQLSQLPDSLIAPAQAVALFSLA